MTATAVKLATRYECLLRDRTGLACQHDSGSGRPPRKRCRYCKGSFLVLHGLWGVFVWTGTGRYNEADALDTFVNAGRAEAHADYLNAAPEMRGLLGQGGAVVRWIGKDAPS